MYLLLGLFTTTFLIYINKNKLFTLLFNKITKNKFLLSLLPKEQLSLDNNRGKISYIYMGHKYDIYIPYIRRNAIKMTDFKAELITNDSIINITQQPGIPYLVNAKQLDGNSIKLTNLSTGATHTYDLTECPLYGTEIME